MSAITLRNVSKHFILSDRRHVPLYRDIINILIREKEQKVIKALDGVSLEIKKGEKIGLIGPNGSGKTTLLRLIAGIYAPTEGECLVEGGVAPFLQGGVNMAMTLSVLDNVKLYGASIGLSRQQICKNIEKILSFSGLNQYEHVPLQLLSAGMQQRMFFSVMLQTMQYRNSSIFIFDESLSAGDQEFAGKCMESLGQLRDSHKTILFSSHSMEQIRKICSKTIYLREGKIRSFDTTERSIKEYLTK